ncbi:hypothetical protein GDO86_000236 [Hymenochirus boettgeri]|uniref:Fibroblast growth factor binding protein 1 n=1 Tax=Hymenochirus boettgeri TaxID=247094 RepID=A0A8T2KDN8_9PIPI|nr:hypothetical protein GDO86_000236 [Hymenochirus boettgeri]
MRLVHIASLSIITLLVSNILLVDGQKQREGKKEREGNGQHRQRGEKKTDTDSPSGKEGQSKGGKGSVQGKFVSKEKADCKWSVVQAQNMTLNIDCKKGESSFSCSFSGNPSSCSKYAGHEKNYWKQITRSLRKQKNICQDHKAVLKSKECKKGPPEAHLYYVASGSLETQETNTNLQVSSTVQTNMGESSKECAEDSDPVERQRVATEYCGETWGSFCNFFLAVVHSKSC